VRSGKLKMQVSRELNLSPKIIYHYTKDIIVGHQRDLGIAGRTLDLLQEIMGNGYAKSSMKYQYKHYQKLRLKFPNIRRVKMYGRAIYYLDDKSDIAARAFLESLDKKITNYYELKEVIKAFKVNIDSEEKRRYVHKKKSKRRGFGKNFETTRLRENDGSFIKNELFHLLKFEKL